VTLKPQLSGNELAASLLVTLKPQLSGNELAYFSGQIISADQFQ